MGQKQTGPTYRMADGRVIGFGTNDFYVEEIPRPIATGMIRALHYSGTHVNNGRIHLGVFQGKTQKHIVGVLQLGYAMNPRSQEKVVANTAVDEYLELNRMWMSEEAPRNSESRAIAYAFKYLRRAYPKIAWVQSFADERCGRLGVVYQAANFLYLGYHWTTFYWLDGVWYHEVNMTAIKRGGLRGQYLRANRHRAEAHRFRQFRYIYFLKTRARRNLRLKVRPYPKPANDNTPPGANDNEGE